jgi:hypothetical protein
LARGGVDRYVAAHLRHDALANGEPEAGAAEAARAHALGLGLPLVGDILEGRNPACRHGPVRNSRDRAIAWVASYEGPIHWEDHDVRVQADGDVAFSHALSRVTGKLKSGAEVDMWFRTTLGLRRTGGRWLIMHNHGFVPFNPESGQASLGLKP